MKNFRVRKILLSGGGTGGSVTPLLAIAEELKKTGDPGEFNFLFVGTPYGPEGLLVEKAGIPFKSISSGKWRRYFSFKNFTDLFLNLAGFFSSYNIIRNWRPDLIITAGSFVSVPLAYAGSLAGVPLLVHQQDVRAGLANKLMAPLAKVVTVTFEKSLKDYGAKAVWTGNPVRQGLKLRVASRESKVDSMPTVLVLGGGTGAQAINDMVIESLPQLTKFCRVIHIVGKGKSPTNKLQITNYQPHEFLSIEEMSNAYAEADVVVTRAGLGTLTELSFLGKPTIIIPIPRSHQEDNAEIFKEQKAAIVLRQDELNTELFVKVIVKLIDDKRVMSALSDKIQLVMKPGANQKICSIIKEKYLV